jgi:hypothetical protein
MDVWDQVRPGLPLQFLELLANRCAGHTSGAIFFDSPPVKSGWKGFCASWRPIFNTRGKSPHTHLREFLRKALQHAGKLRCRPFAIPLSRRNTLIVQALCNGP